MCLMATAGEGAGINIRIYGLPYANGLRVCKGLTMLVILHIVPFDNGGRDEFDTTCTVPAVAL